MKKMGRFSAVGWLVVGASLFALVGCDGGSPDLGTVTGTVTLDGEPLGGAEIVFQPETGRPSYGETDGQGRYELMFAPDQPGAQIGSHRVMISTFDVILDEQDQATEIPERLPPRYHRDSELREDVAPGQNVINFELQSD